MPIAPPPKRMCEAYLRGQCPRQNRCHFSHGDVSTRGDTSSSHAGNVITVSSSSFSAKMGHGNVLGSGGSGASAAAAAAGSAAGAMNNQILVTLLKLVFDVTGTTEGVYRDGGQLHLTRFADLANLRDVKSQIDFNAVFFCSALCEVIKEKCRDAVFVLLDDNNIRNLHVFLKAMRDHGLVHIQGISACGNNIASTDFTAHLRPFKQLVELRLMGNPVTANERYREAVRKALPDLVILDGESVHRPPLSLPWPQPPRMSSEDGQNLINVLAERFFDVAERRGPDAAITVYHEDALFTLSIAPGGEMKGPEVSTDFPRRQDVLKDFVTLRLAQNDRCRNIVTTRGPVRAVRGRADIGAALRHCLYPRGIAVQHNLVNAGITCEFIPCASGTVAMLTIHGTMTWIHSLLPDPQQGGVSRHYERIMCVLPDTNSPIGFYITNDCVLLRAVDTMEPLWAGNAPARMELMGRKYSVHPGIMEKIVPICKSDREVYDLAVTGLQNMPFEAFQECLNCADGNEEQAVHVARVASSFGVPPGRAKELLVKLNWDLGQVKSAIRNGAPL